VKIKPATIYLFPIFTLVLGITLGRFLYSSQNDQSYSETRSPGTYKFINPLLECEGVNFGQDRNLSYLKTAVNNFIDSRIQQKQIDFASIYYRDLNNGPWVGINEKELFSPSSLIKVPLMMTYYKIAESDPSILLKELSTSVPDDPRDQNIKPEVTLVPDQKYTVDELIRRMIIYSDNQAYILLNNNVDQKVLINVYNDLGVDISKGYTDPTGNIISVKAYASFFRILYNSSYLNKAMSEKALQLLGQSKFTQGLVAGLPSDIVVSHKFGERQYMDTRQKQLHDCGIVYLPGKPYLLCIMTRGQDFTNLTSTVKEISALVYQTLRSQN
jgi:beta-lactamase class A